VVVVGVPLAEFVHQQHEQLCNQLKEQATVAAITITIAILQSLHTEEHFSCFSDFATKVLQELSEYYHVQFIHFNRPFG